MSECPRCHQLVDGTAVDCPYCKTPLKAYGHPGIPLYRSQGQEFLCTSCLYHEDDTCNFPQRPSATECTMYHNQNEPLVPAAPSYVSRHWLHDLGNWFRLPKSPPRP